jgi:hypothetical protein
LWCDIFVYDTICRDSVVNEKVPARWRVFNFFAEMLLLLSKKN